jgi:argininosuccinate lyase
MKLWDTGETSREEDELVERFTTGDDISLDEQLVRYDLLGSLAHAYMLREISVLSASEFTQLRGTLLELLNADIRLSSKDEDVHTKIENLLTDKLGELGQKIHTGRSRNDQVLLDTRLFAKEKLGESSLRALDLAERLYAFAQAHEFVPMPGYTHTRRAMPSSLGLWASAFAEGLMDDLQLLWPVYELNDRSPLGAAAGYGVPLALDRELVARLLGFSQVQRNALGVMNSRGKLEFAILTALAGVMMSLSRLANDLILFSADEFGFFKLPERFCTGSSLMPNKQNPDVLELIRARAASVIASVSQLALITHGLTSGYHRDLQETKGPLLRGLETTFAALQIMSALTAELLVDEEKLQAASSADLFAVDEVLEQVKEGLPFRQAYQNVKRQLGRVKALKPEEALKKRRHLGGPGNLRLSELKSEISAQRARWSEARERFQSALEKLKQIS